MSVNSPNPASPAPGDPARTVSFVLGGPKAWLRGALTLGLLAALTGPSTLRTHISEAERALLGRSDAPFPAAGAPVETAGSSVTDGAAALLNNRSQAVLGAGGSFAPGNPVDGERALLNHTASYDQGPVVPPSTAADNGE